MRIDNSMNTGLDWKEAAPGSVGVDPDRLAAVLRWLDLQERSPRFGAQLVVLRRGRVLLDRAVGVTNVAPGARVTPNSRFLAYSAGKVHAALCVHLLAERGLLSLDQRVAEFWPEYAQNGKEEVTIGHALQHRTGAPMRRNVLAEVLALPNWQKTIRAIERLKPRFPPGSKPAYHAFSYGFICGEIVRRVTGIPIERFMEENLLRPLGLTRTSYGLPPTAWEERVKVYAGTPGERFGAFLFNSRRFRLAVIPAASLSTTARETARFYEMLRRGGELDGVRVLAPDTVAAARQVSSDGELDGLIKLPVRWGQGFMLGGPSGPLDFARIMGKSSSREAFGLGGDGCCNIWCDPTRELVFAYLSNKGLPTPQFVAGQSEFCDLILAACT